MFLSSTPYREFTFEPPVGERKYQSVQKSCEVGKNKGKFLPTLLPRQLKIDCLNNREVRKNSGFEKLGFHLFDSKTHFCLVRDISITESKV